MADAALKADDEEMLEGNVVAFLRSHRGGNAKPSMVIRYVSHSLHRPNADVGRVIGHLIETGRVSIGRGAALVLKEE
jgi:hypothetical protein